MLKVFTIKFENNLESFNDSALSNFISDKEITRWESQFFEQKNEHYWTIIIEYISMVPSLEKNRDKGEFKKEGVFSTLSRFYSPHRLMCFSALPDKRCVPGPTTGCKTLPFLLSPKPFPYWINGANRGLPVHPHQYVFPTDIFVHFS